MLDREETRIGLTVFVFREDKAWHARSDDACGRIHKKISGIGVLTNVNIVQAIYYGSALPRVLFSVHDGMVSVVFSGASKNDPAAKADDATVLVLSPSVMSMNLPRRYRHLDVYYSKLR